MTKEQMESELENLKEKFELLENLKEKFEFLKGKVDLMEVLIKKQSELTTVIANSQPEHSVPPVKKVIQINTKDGKSYFCETAQEQVIFEENYPDAKVESFNVELARDTADKYLNESKKHFTKKETVNA